jgi:predicted RNA-binding Zn-ribbon protein involved in translation (DUF1610 family)
MMTNNRNDNTLQRLQHFDEHEAIVRDISISQDAKKEFVKVSNSATNTPQLLIQSLANIHAALQQLSNKEVEQRIPLTCSSCGEASIMINKKYGVVKIYCKHCGKEYVEV